MSTSNAINKLITDLQSAEALGDFNTSLIETVTLSANVVLGDEDAKKSLIKAIDQADLNTEQNKKILKQFRLNLLQRRHESIQKVQKGIANSRLLIGLGLGVISSIILLFIVQERQLPYLWAYFLFSLSIVLVAAGVFQAIQVKKKNKVLNQLFSDIMTATEAYTRFI